MKKVLLTAAAFLILATSAFAEFPAVEVYQKNSKSVVLIIAKGSGESSMIGAGSVILPSGLIATNAHVVIDKDKAAPFQEVLVFIRPDRVTGDFKKDLANRHKAKVIAYDTELDLAVLQMESLPKDVGIIDLANPEEINIGEEAVAIGHPEQGGLWTLTYGRISAEIANQSNIEGKDVFQTDASVNRGNSGGPLLDRRGYMVGINTNIARLGEGDLPITGVNFAVKSSVLRSWLEKQGIKIAYGKKPLTEEKAAPAKVAEQKPVTQETQKLEPPKVEKKIEEVKKPEAENKENEVKKEESQKTIPAPKEQAEKKGEKFQPQSKPYSYDALIRSVEAEMEDMMEDMKRKIRR